MKKGFIEEFKELREETKPYQWKLRSKKKKRGLRIRRGGLNHSIFFR